MFCEGFDEGPVPTLLWAVTTKSYVVPGTRAVTTQLSAVVVHPRPPGVERTTYVLAGLLFTGAVHDTVAWLVPWV
jgi:hypothetical protein